MTADPAAGSRKVRSDRERNRGHILDVAEEFFAEQGVGGPMHDIAKRAGLGPGTLYRHFPTREALLAALLQARFDELLARRAAIEEQERDSGVALERWLEALGEYVTVFDGLPDPLRIALSQQTSPLAITCEVLVESTGQFLAAAQRDGRAQPWVRDRELVLGVLAAAWVSGAALADENSSQGLRAILRAGWGASATGAGPRASGVVDHDPPGALET
ncbi:TetR/AcrR family transcriptional regulator [Cellulomonas aerilata]|uniref:TetR family transcriptional regulator n=1 Tax=Cellulomonas aerilata TaxID=515326 RepID=A0A512DA43_9CELL|nr:TetR/AcrR family transcriptional regulator [Cellulomonas aerilata]GEO33339.1 TetR family transcriptional regulator [Cellulomonas aerilata]